MEHGSDSTLDIKAINPNQQFYGSGDNNPEAAAAARAKLQRLNPKPEPAAVMPIPGAVPAPVSPAAEDDRAAKKARRKPSSPIRPIISAVATFLLLLAIFKSGVLINQLKYLASKPAVQTAAADQPAVGADPVIVIPKINVKAPVVYESSTDEAKIQKALESGVVHYAGTALPGQNGNDVIVGHSSNDWWEPGNYKFVFVLLDKLQPGDTIEIDYQSHRYTYTVTGSKVVEPTDLSVLAATKDPSLTLITCTPPGTSWKRLIVTATQTDPKPGAAATQPTNQPTGQTLPGSAPSFWQQLTGFWHGLFNHDQSSINQPNTSQPANGQLPSAQ